MRFFYLLGLIFSLELHAASISVENLSGLLGQLENLGEVPLCPPEESSIPTSIEMFKCPDSKSPLFAGKEANDVLEVEIVADHDKLNLQAQEPQNFDEEKAKILSPGLITYTENGEQVNVSATLLARGGSRMDCFPRPLKATFGKEVTQGHNVFDKLGDDIKIVNPCQYRNPEKRWLGASSSEEQEAKLLKEFYIYQILEELGTSTLKTRLAKMTYKRPDGSISSSGYAFFREPEEKAALRCGFIEGKGLEQIDNPTSLFQLDLIFAFIGSSDYSSFGTNVAHMHNGKNETLFIPYDFDASVFVTPYFEADTEAEALTFLSYSLKSFLESSNTTLATAQVQEFLSKKQNMIKLIENSLMDEASKKDFLKKMNLQFEVLETYLKK